MAGAAPDSPAARVDSNTAQSLFAGVGSVVVNGSPLSGVVIAGQYVLTAGHVVAGQPVSAIHFALNQGGAQWVSAVTAAYVYPSYNFPYDDLAILRLATAVPAGTPIYPFYSETVSSGLTITLAGYGGSGNGDTGVTVGANSTVKRTGTNTVDALLSTVDTGTRTSRFYLYDFDGPSGNGTGNASETLVAVGDSGGPSFIRVGNHLQLFGINTFVSPPPGQTTVNYEFGTVGGGILACDPRFSSWIISTTQATALIAGAEVPLPLWASGVLAALLLTCCYIGKR